MPDLLTPQTLASAGPLVIDTFLKHFFSHKSLKARSKARGDDLMYDEAFVLMKTFLESATKYPVSSLQKFGQVRTPAPPAVAIHHVAIPHRSLALAAEYLVKAFGGEEMAYKIAGGSKWWQVRAGAGLEAEWIAMKREKREWEKGEKKGREEWEKRKEREGMGGSSTASASGSGSRSPLEGVETGPDSGWRNEMDEMRCMLYIHGGAYYWGSINTHRYTIWRYARKMRGRCFAVNYRKAPQYPFPCAIQDCLAAYLYLTRPPPDALHRPVKPEHIVIAGDSAGGGLVLALLQILRDTEGLELPAGAVLISPWSDLTHSFPSILHNTSTDIVPPYSFIHKPSSLWPPPPPDLTNVVQSSLKSKIKEVASHLRHHPDQAISHDTADTKLDIPLTGRPAEMPEKLRSSQLGSKKKFSLNFGKADLHPTTNQSDASTQPDPQGEPRANPSRANPADAFATLKSRGGENDDNTTLAKCDYLVELEVQGEQVVIDTQVQLYATNAQLCYPLVSPVLGYLGGLCPLYVCCGDNEVLRDEIIFLAHKAANPKDHPIREDVRRMMPHLEGIESRYGPTQVHLQVFDGTGHDLPLFSMCKSARGVFRAISTFARYVTPSASVMPPRKASGNMEGFGMTPLSGMMRRLSSRSRSGTNTPKSGVNSPNSPDLALPDQDISRLSSTHVTPSQSVTDLSAIKPSITTRVEELRISTDGDAKEVLASPLPMTPESRPSATRTTSGISSRSMSGEDSLDKAGPSIPSTPARPAPSGDDAGPRWGFEDDEANAAKPGEAGHPGVYSGPEAFRGNMIRERVDHHGRLRPLEPPGQLGAMTMPSDEIGTIKEGAAMRYLTGQYLWDKRYKRARKQVAKHRQRNLDEARQKDGRRIVESVKKSIEGMRARRAEGGIEEDEEGEEGREEDWSWGWAWALDGEVPPPSAIVSRRDTSEARKLALMADRLDSARPTSVGGLSIWVALATFFSNASEKEKAKTAVKEARERSKKERGRSGETTAAEDSESEIEGR